MKTLSLENALAEREIARTRYAAAVREFRDAYVQLGALDQLLRAHGDSEPGFGEILNVVLLRHGTATQLESGSLQADIAAIVSSTAVEG